MSQIERQIGAAPSNAPTFSPKVVLWLLLVGVFSFSGLVVLSAYAPDFRGGSDTGAHALSHSAVGFAGLGRLLRAEGEAVVISRGPRRGFHPGLLVLTPDVSTKKDQVLRLTGSGPVLVVAPKWRTAPDLQHEPWVYQVGPIPAAEIEKMLRPLSAQLQLTRRAGASPAPLNGFSRPMTTGAIEQLQTFQLGQDLTPVLSDERGGVVLAVMKTRPVFLLSDPDLLNTHGLADLSTARVAYGLLTGLRRGGGPIAFDVSLNGFGAAPSLLKLAFSPPYLGASLCLVAVGVLIGLHAISRFGAPRPRSRALALGKRALADNSAALIRLAGREPRMAGRYLDLSRAAVAKALGLTRMAPDQLDAVLDRLAENGVVSGRLARFAVEAPAIKTRADLLRLAQDLHKWRMEMIGERH